MTKQNELKPSRRNRARTAVAAGVLVTGVAAGGVAASTLTASAATPAASTAAAATGSGSTIAPAAPSKSSTPVRSDEKAVSATLGATLKTKALAAVPGGTVYRIETDAGDGVYEAHMTKADGSMVTVK